MELSTYICIDYLSIYTACGTCPIAAIWLPRATNFSFVFRLFLLWASLDQSKTSTKQKTKKPSQTLHTICGNNYLLCQEMSAQTKQVK